MILHAGLVALRHGGRWRGALIRGPSGAGKSDLALRALDLGLRLVADDRTLVWACAGRLWGRAPEPLAGLIEARGLGVGPAPALAFCPVDLVVDCGEPERWPEPAVDLLASIALPAVVLAAREASAPAKLRRALERVGEA